MKTYNNYKKFKSSLGLFSIISNPREKISEPGPTIMKLVRQMKI